MSAILVLGGTRFIGKALVRRLATEGHEVHVLTRPAHAGIARACGATTVHAGDRRDAALLKTVASRRFDAVFDFLGMDGEDARLAVGSFAGNCERFVHLSTGAIYWVQDATRCPWVESDDKIRLRDRAHCDADEFDYGVAKRDAEAVYRAAARDGFPATIVRSPVVSGPGDIRQRDLYWVRRLLSNRPCLLPDGGRNVFNHVYVDDLVELLARVGLDRTLEPGLAINACDRVFTTLRDYVSWFAEVLDVRPEFAEVPRAAIANAGLHDRSFFFADTKSHVLDNRAAETRYGPIFRTPDAWIPPTVAWCRQQPEDPAEADRFARELRLAGGAP